MGKPHEDQSHTVEVHLIGTVEDDNLKTESTTKILSSLSLTGTSRASGRTSHGEVECLSKGDVTPIGEGCNNESTHIADELVVVPGFPIANG